MKKVKIIKEIKETAKLFILGCVCFGVGGGLIYFVCAFTKYYNELFYYVFQSLYGIVLYYRFAIPLVYKQKI